MQTRARAVVVGGGVTGCSILYHLAEEGWNDLLLLEKGELTSGATCHAAGMLTQFNTSPTIMRMRRYSAALYRKLGVFETVGSVGIASSRERVKTLKRDVSRARGIGLEAELITPEEVKELLPWVNSQHLYGAVYLREDGFLDPHQATHALAAAARKRGASVQTGVRVTGIEVSPGGAVAKVRTTQGAIVCETVVIAAGLWGPQVASMAGIRIPSIPLIHQHAALTAVPGHEIPRHSPTFRDFDRLIYGRPEGGGYLIGGWEADPAACWLDGVPWEHGSTELEADVERFGPLLEGAMARYPFLTEAGIHRLVAHPDAFSPDARPLLGPWPGVHGLWLACAASMQGFGGAGGLGRILARWITGGDPGLDVHTMRPWRFGRCHADPVFAAEKARECYRYYYRTRYPHDEDTLGRPRRLSPLHHRVQELGAVFGCKNGWERVNYAKPGKPWRQEGEAQREWGGWVQPAFFRTVEEEHTAVRRGVGLFDLSSFGKIEIQGPGALSLLQRLTSNDMDRPPGTVRYTQFLNSRGGIEADVVITRLGREHFRIVTGSAFLDADLGWIQCHMEPGETARVGIRDVTEEYAAVGLWGPQASRVLEAVTPDDLAGFSPMSARKIQIAGTDVLAQRVSFVGEAGWEFYPERARAVQVWDALLGAGESFGIRLCGYKAIDSLRLEKGTLAFGSDITPQDNPYEARLGFCVDLESGPFLGREALLKIAQEGITRRLCTLTVGGEDWLPLYGGEAVLLEGAPAGRLLSAGYGYTVRRNIGYAYLPVQRASKGTGLEVDVFGERYPAQVGADTLYAPGRASSLRQPPAGALEARS